MMTEDLFGMGEDCASNSAMRNCLKKALPTILQNELTDKQLKYVTQRYFHGMLQEDIALMFNVKKSTVSRTLHRSHKNIKKALEYVKLGVTLREDEDENGGM